MEEQKSIFDGIKDSRETRVQRGIDFFMKRNQQFLANTLNE
jgi:hypothetical protein